MQTIVEFLSNKVFWVAVLGWFVAQSLKVLITLLVEHKLRLKRFFGLGGMPSSHSAVVCGLAASVGILQGVGSVEFAISAVLAMVVMTDAAGVRRAAGKQAATINRMIQKMFSSDPDVVHETLKELLGHSPLEVLIGGLLGVALAFVVM